jgi:hypothetical protein
MSTPSNPQMTEILINVASNREATNNDLIKHYIAELVRVACTMEHPIDEASVIIAMLQEQIHENAKIGGTQHAPKFVQAIDKKFNVCIKRGYKPTQKYILA